MVVDPRFAAPDYWSPMRQLTPQERAKITPQLGAIDLTPGPAAGVYNAPAQMPAGAQPPPSMSAAMPQMQGAQAPMPPSMTPMSMPQQMSPQAPPQAQQPAPRQYALSGPFFDYLRSQGPALSALIGMGANIGNRGGFNQALQAFIASQAPKPPATDDIAEFQFAQSQGYGGSFDDWLTSGGGASSSSGRYGNTPIYGLDDQGNTAILRMAPDGSLIRAATPEGVSPLSPAELYSERARGRAEGTGIGEARVNLGAVEENSATMLTDIDAMLSTPGLDRVTGAIGGQMPDWMHAFSREASEARSLQRKLLADTFRVAFESLKGGGQITEFESQSAARALSRLDDFQLHPDDYRQALEEFRTRVVALRGLARRRAANPSAYPPRYSEDQPYGDRGASNIPPAPPGIDPITWGYMTDEQRAEWQN